MIGAAPSREAAAYLPEGEGAIVVSPARARLILGAALLAVLVGSLDLTVIATLLPKMVSDLQVNTADLDRYIWVVSGYLLAYMVTIPVLGRVSDLIGRKAVFAASLAIFVVGSVVTARATGLGVLITGRVIQGFGGGALVPVTMALVGDVLPARRRAAVIGLVGAVDTLGWVLGPLYGAALLGLTGRWQAVFWINLPVSALTVLILLFAWRGVRPRAARAPLDLLGALLLTAGLVCLNLALSTGQEAGSGAGQLGGSANPLAPYRWPLLVGAVLAGLLFALWERRATAPLIPLGLLGNRVFAAATVANLLIGAALIVVMVDVPLFASLVEEETQRASLIGAALLTPFTLTMAVGSILGGALTGRWGARAVAATGILIGGVGLFTMRLWPDRIAPAPMSASLIVAGLGFGIVIAPIASVAISVVRRAFYGVASGLVVVTRLIGMTVGLSVLSGWGVGRLSGLLQANAPAKNPGEADLAYQTRLFMYLGEQTLPFSLVVLRETFVIAGVVCLMAIIPALLLVHRHHGSETDAPTVS